MSAPKPITVQFSENFSKPWLPGPNGNPLLIGSSYIAGERASFPPETAAALQKAGVAVPVPDDAARHFGLVSDEA